MKVEKMTVQQYAALRKISDAAVRRAIIHGFKMPGVIGHEKFGRAHVLTVDKKLLQKSLEVTKA